MHIKINSNIAIALFFLVFLIFIKLLFLDSDTVTIPNLHNEDEGNYVYNVRNYIVEGDFFKDETNFILLSPLYSLLLYIPTSLLGISIFNFRLVSALMGIFCILLIYKVFTYNKNIASISSVLLYSDFLFNVHSRIAMPEVTASFFFLFTSFLYLKAHKKRKILLYFLTGLTAGLGFLVKSNAVIIIGVCIIFESFTYLKQNIKKITSSKQYFIYLCKANLALIIGFLGPILYWYFFIIKPNLQHFELVNIGLIKLHKPQIKGQLLDLTYLWNELKEFIIGGEGNIWLYLIPYFLTIFGGIVYIVKNKININNKTFWFSVLWFFIGNVYFYVLWYKPSRWYIPNLIPLIIITSFFINIFPKKLKAFILTFIIGANLILNFEFIYSKPTFYLKNVSLKVDEIVGTSTYAGDSLILMENKNARAFNPYFIQPVYTTDHINSFLQANRYPTYLVFIENQWEEEVLNSGMYRIVNTSILSSNIKNKRPITIFRKLIFN